MFMHVNVIIAPVIIVKIGADRLPNILIIMNRGQ